MVTILINSLFLLWNAFVIGITAITIILFAVGVFFIPFVGWLLSGLILFQLFNKDYWSDIGKESMFSFIGFPKKKRKKRNNLTIIKSP